MALELIAEVARDLGFVSANEYLDALRHHPSDVKRRIRELK